jgi:hypothetical protein
MNLLKKIFGKWFACDKKETCTLDDSERVARYREVENSPELKEYLELDKLMMSEEFVQKKYNWQKKDFKMTDTYAVASRYKELLNDEDLQQFLELEESTRLKNFLKFKASKDYAKLQDKEAVAQSTDLQRMAKFENSDEYKLYLKYLKSELPKEYKALVAKMETPEFKKDYAFWSNPNRWKTTPEYQQHVRYKQLSKRADIVFYLQQDPKEIARLEKALGKKK